MPNDAHGDDGGKPSEPKIFPSVLAQMEDERQARDYAQYVAHRAAEPERVTRFEVEVARVEYLDELQRLRKQGIDGHWQFNDQDRICLDVFKLSYEALQERLADQRRDAEAAEAARVIASNAELSRRQTSYAKIVMWVVIVQTALGALALAQSLHWLPEARSSSSHPAK